MGIPRAPRGTLGQGARSNLAAGPEASELASWHMAVGQRSETLACQIRVPSVWGRECWPATQLMMRAASWR